MVDEKTDNVLSQEFNIPGARKGSIKNNESEIFLLKRRIRELEARIEALEP
jgi:hypothetical protein